jgi:hypothetical protein
VNAAIQAGVSSKARSALLEKCSRMKKTFTWERGPFDQCWQCKEQTLGMLSAGGNTMALRCTKCRFTVNETLPAVDKAVIYLDQFVFSNIFKIKAGGKPRQGLEDFYGDLLPLLNRVVHLQQAIFPHSDIHRLETMTFNDANGLRDSYKCIGGDIELKSTVEIEREQIFEFAKAFRDGREPHLSFSADSALKDTRNDWLEDMRITAEVDYSQFANAVGATRDQNYEEFKPLFENWRKNPPSFSEQLMREFEFGRHRTEALYSCYVRLENPAIQQNPSDWIEATNHRIFREFRDLRKFFKQGSDEDSAEHRVHEFWHWQRLNEMPSQRISAYLFAALSRKVVSGHKNPTRGFTNDFNAISAYAPYVDAMFVDKECAAFLAMPELKNQLKYKARIFCYSNKAAFLDYLRELEVKATDDIRRYANRIYGLT